MRQFYSQPGCPDSLPLAERERLIPELQVRHPVRLVVETIALTGIALAAIRVLHVRGPASVQWLAIPGVLVVASLVPTWIGRRPLPFVGADGKDVGLALGAVCRTFVYVLPLMFLAFWLMRRLSITVPLRPTFGPQHDWLTWLLYQFLYVAAAEEMFFRGYVQANVMRVLNCGRWRSSRTDQGIAVLISASCFALAHVIVQGDPTATITFLPGVVLAWLFIQTRSLLAPILFHGLANVTYAVMALTLG